MRTCTCNLVVCVCALASVAGCGSSVKVTRDGKAIRSPVSVIVMRDFTAESGVHVPEKVVQGITSTCVQSLGDEVRIKPVPVTRETSNPLPEGAIDVRGQFTTYEAGLSFAGSVSASVVDLQIQIAVHDSATGTLLASKPVKKHYFWVEHVMGGGFHALGQDEVDAKVCTAVAKQVKDVVLGYLTASGRKPKQ